MEGVLVFSVTFTIKISFNIVLINFDGRMLGAGVNIQVVEVAADGPGDEAEDNVKLKDELSKLISILPMIVARKKEFFQHFLK